MGRIPVTVKKECACGVEYSFNFLQAIMQKMGVFSMGRPHIGKGKFPLPISGSQSVRFLGEERGIEINKIDAVCIKCTHDFQAIALKQLGVHVDSVISCQFSDLLFGI